MGLQDGRALWSKQLQATAGSAVHFEVGNRDIQCPGEHLVCWPGPLRRFGRHG